MRDRWSRVLFAVGVIVLAVGFYGYLLHRANLADQRQRLADLRNERQRAAICAILANIPGKVPAEIESARLVFARHGHPRDCQPLVKHSANPVPEPTPEPPRTSLVIIEPPAPVRTPTSPSPSRTASPRPTPTPSPSATPSPTPSPSCLHVNPLGHSIHIC